MKPERSILRRVARWIKRGVKLGLTGLGLYFAILAIGLIPVNNDFRPAKNGVEIYLISSAVHADIIVPKLHPTKDWTTRFSSAELGESLARETHLAFGWGDRGFYLETETWDDLKLSTVANALLLPSTSCMHVTCTRPGYYKDAVAVTISDAQYGLLVEFLEDSFQQTAAGNFEQIAGYAYSTNDAFYVAKGRYHLLNTCNSWVGRGLKVARVRVPWYSPMPKTPMLYIETEAKGPQLQG